MDKNQDTIELNEKIKQIVESLGYTSSRFADHIGVSRPVMSHVLASRNKASLEIIQRMLIKFPGLGIDWTFDGNLLDTEMLTIIADHEGLADETSLDNLSKRKIIKILICHTDGLFTDYDSGGLSDALISRERGNESSGKPIEKIIVFYSDNSLKEFKPA